MISATPAPEINLTGAAVSNIKAVVDAFRISSVSLDLHETLAAVLDGLKSLIDYDAASIDVIAPGTDELRGCITRGYADDVGLCARVAKGQGIVGSVLERGAPILIADVQSDPRYRETRPATRSEMAVPIIGTGGKVIGVLNLEADQPNYYDAGAVELVTLFAVAAAVAIEKATLHGELMEKRKLESELEIAREVMQGLLPRGAPQLDGFEIAAVYQSSRQVGGDYYDFIPIDGERWALVVADVIGKGVPAALLASALRASLHSLARNELALRSVLHKANRFFRESAREGQFATLFYAELDVKARRLIYANAGHLPPLLLRANGECAWLESGGPPLGIVERPRYLEEFTALGQGDVLVLYTDGVTEAMNEQEQDYGSERLAQAVAGARTGSAADICQAVVQDLKAFGGARATDDRTLVVIKAI